MPGEWIFEWYTPEQTSLLRPAVWLQAIGITPPATPPEPFLISDRDRGQRVRFRSLVGASGPLYTIAISEVPFLPGSRLKFINVDNAEIDLRVLFTADSRQLLWARLEEVVWYFQPLRGNSTNEGNLAGTLKVTNPSGAERYLTCTCISGFKLDESTLEDKSVEVTLTFLANDPYWYSDWITDRYVFLDPLYVRGPYPALPVPIAAGPDRITTQYTVPNNGDVNSYPVFVIEGPGTDPIFINNSLPITNPIEQSLDLSAQGGVVIPDGGRLTANFINKTVLVPGVGPPAPVLQSRLYNLTRESRFWPLIPKTENIVWTRLTNTTLNTAMNVIYRHAYSTMM